MACGSAAAAGEGWGSELKAAVPGRLEGQVVMIVLTRLFLFIVKPETREANWKVGGRGAEL